MKYYCLGLMIALLNISSMPEGKTEVQNAIQSPVPVVEEVAAVNKYSITEEEYNLLLNLVYCEARGESLECQMMVIQVVLNRAYHDDRFPNTIKDVVYAKGQFSPVSSGAINRAVPTETNREALDLVLKGADLPENVFYFWGTSVNINKGWFKKMHQNSFYRQIDSMYFYYG